MLRLYTKTRVKLDTMTTIDSLLFWFAHPSFTPF
jgi:hypothetical protein